ncbi:MAG: hypothetical protein J5700_05415, partial [Treponema sp.]|nr:hypothetical protein [Treponema sp.]
MIALGSALFCACSNSSDSPAASGGAAGTNPGAGTDGTNSGGGGSGGSVAEGSEKAVALSNFYLWNGSTGSYDASSKKLTLNNGTGGNGAGFSFSENASAYKYAKLSY